MPNPAPSPLSITTDDQIVDALAQLLATAAVKVLNERKRQTKVRDPRSKN